MPDIVLKGFSEEEADTLKSRSIGAGHSSRDVWLAEIVKKMAVVPERYGFRVHGQSGGKGQIRRFSDHLNGVSVTFAQFGQMEADAMYKAEDFVRRNYPGDKEKAYDILVDQFGEDGVFEIPVQ